MSISVRNEKVSIRHAVIADAENLITLRKRLFKQTQYMLFEDEEYNPSVESEIRFIEHFAQSNNSTVLVDHFSTVYRGDMDVRERTWRLLMAPLIE